jgi:hypothetical protein
MRVCNECVDAYRSATVCDITDIADLVVPLSQPSRSSPFVNPGLKILEDKMQITQ